MPRILVVALLALFLVPTAIVAAGPHGRQVHFVGVHPIPKGEGGGTCYIEGPHVHIYAAPDKVQYRVTHDGDNHFVGDPVAYGYDGPKYTYKGPHPIHVDGDTEWCYLEGPHFHAFEAEGPEFKTVGDVNFFVGEPPKVYFDERPAYVKINAMYTPMAYERPVVAVEAPDGWVGARVDVIAPVVVVPVVPSVEVVAPSVEVHVPMPSVHIGIGIGGNVGVGGGVFVDERYKHDNGRHRGHHK